MTVRGMAELPLRAAYTVAARIERRRLRRALDEAGVIFLRSGRVNLVSLSELERKVPTLWEGIKAAYAIGGEE